MSSFLSTLLLALALRNGPHPGLATYYAPGGFAHVAAVRHMPLAGARVAGYAAVPNCAYVDARRPWVVWARLAGGPPAAYQVVDCVAPRDRARHRTAGLILEVDYATALRYPRLQHTGHIAAQVLGYRRLGRP